MRYLIFLLVTVLSVNFALAQNLHSKSKKAIQLYKQARELDSVGNYFQSEPLLMEALKKDKSFDEAYLLLFTIRMKKGDVNGADRALQVATPNVETSFKNRMTLELATFFWSNGRYEDALTLKNEVTGEIYGTDKKAMQLVMESIDFATESKRAPLKVNFQELPNTVNIFPSQYFPTLTANGQMVFTGRSRGRRGENEDLFITELKNGKWVDPRPLSDSINTVQLNEGTASISADGLSVVFTGCNRPEGQGSCDLYASYFLDGEWTKPQNLGETVNSEHWDSQPSLSQDGRQLFFVSMRPGGFGGQDLWMSHKIDNKWTKAQNMGSTINTRLDDCSPFIHPDGETFFYASRGKVGLGGYDLYKTRITDDGWLEPQNLGFPINTFENQVGYTLSLDGWAYYSDNNLLGQTKLYRFKMPESLLPERKLNLFAGLVKDSKTGEPLSADIYLTDLNRDSTVVSTYSKRNGTFNFIPPDLKKDYMVYTQKTGYNLYKAPLNGIEKVGEQYLIELKPLAIGDKVVLNNILFELNSAKLDAKARKELQIATTFLKENTGVKIEIGGHTDAVGEASYNLSLSESRAKAVYDYLLNQGVLAARLAYKGYGEGVPIEGTESDDKSALNRRIELIVINF